MFWNLLENTNMKIGHYTMEDSERLLGEALCENLEAFECNVSWLTILVEPTRK